MIEIGTLGFPYRVSAIAVGTAMSVESDGSHAVWFPDQLLAAPDRALWQEAAGPLAAVVPDPTDLADPVVAAASALLATRRIRVGVLALELDDDPQPRARAIATLDELAPGRVIAAVDARAAAPDRETRTPYAPRRTHRARTRDRAHPRDRRRAGRAPRRGARLRLAAHPTRLARDRRHPPAGRAQRERRCLPPDRRARGRAPRA